MQSSFSNRLGLHPGPNRFGITRKLLHSGEENHGDWGKGWNENNVRGKKKKTGFQLSNLFLVKLLGFDCWLSL